MMCVAEEGSIPDLPDSVSHQEELSSPKESFHVGDFNTTIPTATEQRPEVVQCENELKMPALEPRYFEEDNLGPSLLPRGTNDFEGDKITTPAPELAPDTDVCPTSLRMPHLPIPASGRVYWYFLIVILLFFSVLCSLYFNKI